MIACQDRQGFCLTFEDYGFPCFLKSIYGRYGYRTRDKRRISIRPEQVVEATKRRGCSFQYEKATDRYYLLYPVPVDYFPSEDKRCDNQATCNNSDQAISLDPGVRKFLTGYSPDGSTTLIGQDANKLLMKYFLQIDQEKNPEQKIKLWRRVKNLIDDLHWKSINYLNRNYGTVILGDIRISSILKSKQLHRLTKRVLSQYSFCKFKTRLGWKLSLNGNNLVLVNEAYTSKTCSECGNLTNVGSSENFKCHKCNNRLDRDVNGARNIMIKALTLTSV